MRLGGPVSDESCDPERWVADVKRRGYTAVPAPLQGGEPDAIVQAYVEAATAGGVLIAEVGAWSNPLSPDEATRKAALELCQERLALADAIGARCCVNIAGSRGEQWDGPHPDNLTEDTFALIVETVRKIIDAVHPTRTFYALEPMPWIYPDSAEAYLRLIAAIDRPRFAAHLDPVNLVSSPQLFYDNASLMRECFQKLGPYIKSCHAKDIRLSGKLTVHLDEVRPGLGSLDYRTFLREIDKLDPDTPLLLEHLPSEEEYALAAGYVRSVAQEIGIAC
ncbi:MAG TPA: sugar phosphate isomerase/epimerase [Herpetosiphonaceae bacterium]|nr:sugar phosphate isomerase/epimerase [Herpetosiphonaceae bacterium]